MNVHLLFMGERKYALSCTVQTKAGYTPQDCPDYLGGSKDYLIRFSCGVRCVKSD